MKLSIVIAVYNCDNFLPECMFSVLNQDFVDYEILLVVDGSSDNCSKICDEFSLFDDRVIVIHKKNEGSFSARNAGICIATGDYITFIDADDKLIDKSYLSELIKCKDFEYVAAGITHQYYDENGKLINENTQSLSDCFGEGIDEFPNDFFIYGYIHSCCTKLYRTSILRQYNIKFPKFRVSEDTAFNIDYLSTTKKWKIIHNSGYGYRHIKKCGSVSSKFIIDDADIYGSLYQKLLDFPIKKNIAKKMMFYQFYGLCNKCVKCTDYSNKQKKKFLYSVMKKSYVKNILLTSKVCLVDRIRGFALFTCCLSIINACELLFKFF